MYKYWSEGDHCVFRGIVNHQVWSARSVIVVKDQPDETVLLLIPGADCVFPEGYWRWKKNKDYSQGTRWQEAKQENIVYIEFAWQTNRILIFLEPGKYYACFMFWDHASGQFNGYYINYQLPYVRSHCGFDTLDLDLDIVIDPQYRWEWKDEDHYQEGIRQGGIKSEWVAAIEESHAEVLSRIARRSYPLDGSWLDWQPDEEWGLPKLPEKWQYVET
jgi:hypothetical protein